MADGYIFPVDATSIMLFASALGETNKIYYDEAYAEKTPLGGVIAPPSYPIASSLWDPGYALKGVRRIPAPTPTPTTEVAAASATGQERGGGDSAGGGGGGLTRGLHAEQRFDYHKPLSTGMKLSVTTRSGKSWEKEGRRGGTLRFGETVTDYRDADGELVVTATMVGVTTSKAVEDQS